MGCSPQGCKESDTTERLSTARLTSGMSLDAVNPCLARAASTSRCPGLMASPLCSCSTYYSAHAAYAQSKLALVLFTYHLQALLTAQGMPVTASVADPGVVDTDLYRYVFWGTRLVKKLLGWWVFKVKAPTLGVLLRSAGRSDFTLLDAAVLPFPGSTSSFSVHLLMDTEVASMSR